MRQRRVHTAAVLSLLLTVVCALAQPLAAQATSAVRGQVIEAATQQPLAGVQVFVPGTGRGTITDARGNFLITGLQAGSHTLQAQMIGYGRAEQAVTLAADQTATVQLQLSQAAVELDAVIVTGTAGATRARTLGNAVSSISAPAITEAAPITTVTQLLQGRSPGLTVMPTSGQVGAAASYRIRGASSVYAGNQPVFYIDGVRVRSGSQTGFGTSNDTGRETSYLDGFNPNDIESIEIIRGPAAATLYGADAASGVIHIITKKGLAAGSQGIRFNGRVEMGQNEWKLGMRENFTLCTNDANELAHVGMQKVRRIGHASWPGCANMDPNAPWQDRVLRETPLAAPGVLRTGDIRRYSLSARGGGERYSFFISGENEDEDGVFSNNWFERQSARVNFSVLPSDNLTVDFRVAYTNYASKQPLNDNASNGWLRNSWRGRPGFWTSSMYASGWAGLGPDEMRLYDNTIDQERWVLGATADFRPVSWFRNRLTLGFDAGDRNNTIFYEIDKTGRAPYGTPENRGYISHFMPSTRDYTVDYAGTIDHSLSRFGITPELTSSFSFGMQYAAENYRSVQLVGIGLVADALRLISSAAEKEAYESRTEARSLGFWVQEMVGWKNRLFVTGAVRMDDHSAFGANFSRIYYPKVSVSHVISEEPFFSVPFVSSLKLRAAYGHAGNAPAPFEADRTYEATQVVLDNGSLGSALEPGDAGNPDLRAERGRELEFGFDASLFNNALGLEVTYYNNTTKDALMREPVPPSSGYEGTVLRNVGEINNRGFEFSVFGSPLRSSSFVWDTRATLATNQNKLVSFGELARDFIPIGYRGSQRHVAGYPLGGYWARPLLRNADGSLQRNANGTPILSTDYQFIGTSVPSREASLTNTFTVLRNLQLYTFLDYKGGHHLFNMSEQFAVQGDFNHRAANDPTISEEEWLVLRYGDVMPYIERADFIKLREVSVRYNVNSNLVRRLGADGLSISLAGRNLAIPWTRYKSGADPEVNIGRAEVNSGGATNFTRGESNSPPMMRQLVATFDFRF